jgi:guanylate kinase
MSSERQVRRKSGLIFIISGPSGSGKTTLLKSLLETKGLKNKLVKSISFTTRPKRWGEKNGKDYFFISEREFQQKRKEKKFLEWTRYLGYYYATPKDFMERHLGRGRHIVLCLDLKGALKIKRLYPHNTVTVFVMSPSLEALRQRIKKRSKKVRSPEINQRMRLAKKELAAACRYDYSMVNKDLRQAVTELKEIIITSLIA